VLPKRLCVGEVGIELRGVWHTCLTIAACNGAGFWYNFWTVEDLRTHVVKSKRRPFLSLLPYSIEITQYNCHGNHRGLLFTPHYGRRTWTLASPQQLTKGVHTSLNFHLFTVSIAQFFLGTKITLQIGTELASLTTPSSLLTRQSRPTQNCGQLHIFQGCRDQKLSDYQI
jgi:hypothetical protein